MNHFLTVSLVLVSCGCTAYSLPLSHHSMDKATLNKFEKMNVEVILKSDRLLNNYMKCLLDNGKCNNTGEELKRILPQLLSTKCHQCTPSQRTKALKVVTHLSVHKPDMWKKLKQKFAPNAQISDFENKAKRHRF